MMLAPKFLVLGLFATAIPLSAAQDANAPANTTQKIEANIVDGIDLLINKISASYKNINNGFIRIPDIENFMAPDFQEGIFGDLSTLQRGLALVRESTPQSNPKTVTFQVTLPETIVKYNKIKIGLGIFIPKRELTCVVKNQVYDTELSINYSSNGCVANLSKFEVGKKGISKCKLTGGYISFIDEFLSQFVNAWNLKLVNVIKENISNAIQSHLKTDFDCEKYRTVK